MDHATIENVRCGDELSAEARKNLSEYLAGFLAPVIDSDSIRCPCCNAHIWSGDGIMDYLIGTFTWGLVHGDGFCGRCKWPIRMYHFVKLDGPDEKRLVYPLAYRCYEDEAHAVEIDPKASAHERMAAAI